MKLGFLTACMPEALAGRHRRLGAGGRLRGARGRRLAPDRRPRLHRQPPRRRRPRRGRRRRACARSSIATASRCRRSPTTTTTCTPIPRRAGRSNAHVAACIEAAALLGCPSVGTFVGRDPSRTRGREPGRGRARVQAARRPGRRARRGRSSSRTARWRAGTPTAIPGTWPTRPELWEWMFSLGLLLNFDPSHLLWLGIDPIAALRPYVDRVAHAHAKDAEVFPERRDRYGVFGKTRRAHRRRGTRAGGATACPGSARSTGRGSSTPSTRAASTASSRSSTRIRSGAATEERVKAGLEVAHRTLRPLIVR